MPFNRGVIRFKGFNLSIVQLSRFTIGLMWIYQGVFPKLIHIAPLELQMSSSLGFTEQVTYWFIKVAGVSEVIFGVFFIIFYKVSYAHILNMLALLGLLLFAAVQTPALLTGAFNPVTTNIPLLVLSYYLFKQVKSGSNV